MSNKLHHGDCLEVMPTLDADSVDAIISDPPYGLSFMGKAWDHGVPGEIFWREALRVAKPGAHLLAFGGTRTFHRLAVAIEDAGWEIRDTVMWVYGSGFPKSHDVGKGIDKRGGNAHRTAEIGAALRAAREAREMSAHDADVLFCGGSSNWTWFEGRPRGQRPPTPETFGRIAAAWPEVAHLAAVVAEAERDVVAKRDVPVGHAFAGAIYGGDSSNQTVVITAPATAAAQQWDGWGTALKPAWEPIIVARKPLIGTVAANVLVHGTGGLNIDECRVGTSESLNGGAYAAAGTDRDDGWGMQRGGAGEYQQPTGRWPANLIHDGSDEVTAGFPDAGGGFGVRGRGGQAYANGKGFANTLAVTGQEVGYGDTDSAARFFYCAKASKADREEGCEGIQERTKRILSGGIPSAVNSDPKGMSGGGDRQARNNHPTVKPTALMRYLCKLVTPHNGIILDPFMGSGSTGKAATLERFNFIGIDLSAEYVAIAQARIDAATKQIAEQFQYGSS